MNGEQKFYLVLAFMLLVYGVASSLISHMATTLVTTCPVK